MTKNFERFCVLKIPSELKFLKDCPYFISNECKSLNWNLEGPCGKCLEQGVYDKKNAELIDYKIDNSR